jgi:hypothetical protein
MDQYTLSELYLRAVAGKPASKLYTYHDPPFRLHTNDGTVKVQLIGTQETMVMTTPNAMSESGFRAVIFGFVDRAS